MTSQIFVSYAREDTTVVEPFLKELEEHLPDEKYHIWYDKKITLAEPWQEEIERALEVSFAIIVILTPRSNESKYVTYEWSYMLGKGRRVITLMLEEPEKIHSRLDSLNWLEFSQPFGKPWDKLVAALDKAHQEFLSSTGPILALELLHDGRDKHQQNDLHNALDTLNHALDFAPDHLKDDILYEIATVYREMQTEDDARRDEYLKQARAKLQEALQHNPNHVRAIVMLGEFYRDEGDTIAERAKEADNDKEKEAYMQEVERLFVSAEAQFRSALAIQPDILDESGESVWASLGGILKRRGDTPKAIDCYRRATHFRQSSYPYNNLGLLYMQQGDVRQMQSTFEIVNLMADSRIKQNPLDVWAYNDFLVSLIVLGENHIDTATNTFRRIMLVSQQPKALRTLLGTLKSMAALPGASQGTLDFIGDTVMHLQQRVDQLGGAD